MDDNVDDTSNGSAAKSAPLQSCIYSIVQKFSGESLGRQIKREFLKLALVELFSGFSLFVISAYEGLAKSSIICWESIKLYRSTENNFLSLDFFAAKPFGSTIISFQYLVSIMTFFLGVLSMCLIYSWIILTISRRFFSRILSIYCFLTIAIFLLTLWCSVFFFINVSKFSVFVRIQTTIVFATMFYISFRVRM